MLESEWRILLRKVEYIKTINSRKRISNGMELFNLNHRNNMYNSHKECTLLKLQN
jgi:hypothetical protein